MKIEIEFEEVEYLKKEIEHLKEQKQELERRLLNCGEIGIQDRIVSLANEMFFRSMGIVFEKLGFDKPIFLDEQICGASGMPVRLPLSEANTIDLVAEVSANFKRAYMLIGVDTDKFKK